MKAFENARPGEMRQLTRPAWLIDMRAWMKKKKMDMPNQLQCLCNAFQKDKLFIKRDILHTFKTNELQFCPTQALPVFVLF